MKINDKLSKLIQLKFPKINHAIAYGSAAIPQKENTGKMIDLIFIVKDINSFHKKNLLINQYHYSFIARFMLGSRLISYLNDKGSYVYYNPSVVIQSEIDKTGEPNDNTKMLIKYGVISEDKAIANIKKWDNLFLCGRLHKPVIRDI